MEIHEHCLTLARYDAWAYRRLYQVVGELSDDDYRADRGLFFGSVHRTLNHLLLVSHLWRGRLSGDPFQVSGLDQELETDREALELRLLESCSAFAEQLGAMSPSRFHESFAYTNTEGVEMELPVSAAVCHLFNHATHHRGQISAALTGMGRAAPVMDLPYFLLEP